MANQIHDFSELIRKHKKGQEVDRGMGFSEDLLRLLAVANREKNAPLPAQSPGGLVDLGGGLRKFVRSVQQPDPRDNLASQGISNELLRMQQERNQSRSLQNKSLRDFQLEAFKQQQANARTQAGINEKRNAPTTLERNLISAGLAPGSPEFREQMLSKTGRSSTNINVNNPSEAKAFSKAVGEQDAKFLGKIVDDGFSAEEEIQTLDQMLALDPGSGILEPVKQFFGEIAADLGLEGLANNIASVNDNAAFNSLSNKLVNAVLNRAKGPQTEGDARRALKVIASIKDPALAQKYKINVMKALALRKKQMADFFNNERFQLQERGKAFGSKEFLETRKKWAEFTKRIPNVSDSKKLSMNGLPVFFFQFEENAKRNDPNVSDEQIASAWIEVNK